MCSLDKQYRLVIFLSACSDLKHYIMRRLSSYDKKFNHPYNHRESPRPCLGIPVHLKDRPPLKKHRHCGRNKIAPLRRANAPSYPRPNTGVRPVIGDGAIPPLLYPTGKRDSADL
ncbi:hypothetical protein AVEN_137847-1 [Araneus ventricosus]|uniref:Uncharacterized protein n=1 Tax=Araneus ventricosus TaxID=182803 RepID=A0A4Y2QG50_ARAVE|nr:hypothetical protein AVEN_137847-1 [Araneus ventricosus]